MTPCRLMDTRTGSGQTGAFGAPMLSASVARTVPIPTHPNCSVPATAVAYVLNFTVVPTTSVGYLSAWPTGNQPTNMTSILNSPLGQIAFNGAVVAAGISGSIDVYATSATDLIIDITGYYVVPLAEALGAGSSVAPSLTFTNDTNSGIYSPAAGMVAVTASGNNILRVNSSGILVTGNMDFSGQITQNGTTLVQSSSSGTGVGYHALGYLGGSNVAFGPNALGSGTSGGTNNAALGYKALLATTSGSNNTAVGTNALGANITGYQNTVVGSSAAQAYTDNHATALGYYALHAATAAHANTALGAYALGQLGTGTYNIALGADAGWLLNGSESNNIYIDNSGVAGESKTIRIGGGHIAQTATYIAGVYGAGGSGNLVYAGSDGKIFTLTSSRRFKQDIRGMGDTTDVIMGLRPVRFRYKSDGPHGPERYGLIAEEVNEVAPDLVGHGNDGQIDSVRWDKVYAMLLNEVQKQNRLIQEQQQSIQQLQDRLAALEAASSSKSLLSSIH